MANRSEVMRFSVEHQDGADRFTVTWMAPQDRRPLRTEHYRSAAAFWAWLVTVQGYSLEEADEAIDQLLGSLRLHAPPPLVVTQHSNRGTSGKDDSDEDRASIDDEA